MNTRGLYPGRKKVLESREECFSLKIVYYHCKEEQRINWRYKQSFFAILASINKVCLFLTVLFAARLTAYIPATYITTPIIPLRNAVK